jgi:hypothetical protein
MLAANKGLKGCFIADAPPHCQGQLKLWHLSIYGHPTRCTLRLAPQGTMRSRTRCVTQLQIALGIALRYALHRRDSRVIHRHRLCFWSVFQDGTAKIAVSQHPYSVVWLSPGDHLLRQQQQAVASKSIARLNPLPSLAAPS